MSEKVKAQYTEETIHNRPFIVKGISVNTYESDYYRRRAKDIHARACYMRIMTLYNHGSWITLNGRQTGARFRAYYYSVKYDQDKKKWIWQYTGCYYVTLAPNMQHTVKNRWLKPYDNHNRKYTYVYRYEPTTYHKIEGPPTETKTVSQTPLETLSLLSPATLINTLDQMNILEETLAIHSTLSNLSSPFVTSTDPPTAEFDVQLAIALSETPGELEVEEAEGEEKVEKVALEKF